MNAVADVPSWVWSVGNIDAFLDNPVTAYMYIEMYAGQISENIGSMRGVVDRILNASQAKLIMT